MGNGTDTDAFTAAKSSAASEGDFSLLKDVYRATWQSPTRYLESSLMLQYDN